MKTSNQPLYYFQKFISILDTFSHKLCLYSVYCVYRISSFCVVFTFQFGSVHIYCHFSSSQQAMSWHNLNIKLHISISVSYLQSFFYGHCIRNFTIPFFHKIYVNKTIRTFIWAPLSHSMSNIRVHISLLYILYAFPLSSLSNSRSIPSPIHYYVSCFMSMHSTSQKIITWLFSKLD